MTRIIGSTSPRPPNLITSIVNADRPLDAQVSDAVAAGATMVELRADRIADLDAVATLLGSARRVPYILTIRSAAEGGTWDGDEAERIALIERLGLLMPGFVDVELSTWRRSANLRQKIGLVCDLGPAHSSRGADRPRNQMILSHHALSGTPSDTELLTLLGEMMESPAGVIKMVFRPSDVRDAIRILTLRHYVRDRRRLIVMGVGDAGVLTRVQAARLGLYGAFAAIAPGEEAAPGQPTLDEMISLYRWRDLRSETRVFGVIGWPVAHSLSPRLHNLAMSGNGVPGVYLRLPVEPTYGAFTEFMSLVTNDAELGFAGFSVTTPHKEHALRWLAETSGEISPAGRACGAVNTLTVRTDGSWAGDNTDVSGARVALSGACSSGARVGVLGSGGVARAVVLALREIGCGIILSNRTFERARVLAQELGCDAAAWEERANLHVDTLINCTSVGMTPYEALSPMPADGLHAGMTVIDSIYTPEDTRLLRDARERGCRTVSGSAFFMGQAREQYQIWHGRAPGYFPEWTMLRST